MAGEEAVVYAFLQGVCERVASAAAVEGLPLPPGTETEMGRLSTTVVKVLPFVEDAEEKQRKDEAVSAWLRDLKEAAYDVDDILDQLSLELEEDGGAATIGEKQRALCCLFSSSSGLRHGSIAWELKAVRERLDKIANKRRGLRLRLTNDTSHRRLKISEGLDTNSIVLGREEEREEMMLLLLSDGPTSFIPIVGRGGLGKTALARLVYNDERAVNHFELRIWVCAADIPDSNDIYSDQLIIRSSHLCKGLSMEELEGKRFLVVLDDVCDERFEWKEACSCFDVGEEGSRIVVTTRSDRISIKMGTAPSYHLNGLSIEDSWLLFRGCAFGDGASDEHTELEDVGKKIVEKLEGLPWAIQMIGCLLGSNLERSSWDSILESDVWGSQLDENHVPPALRLFYQHLPSQLQQCFAYCSVFPKYYKFGKDELIQMWMAQGLLRCPGKQMENVGSEYFDYFLSMSFFRQISSKYMLFHDLAQFIPSDICVSIHREFTEEQPQNISKSTRHLFLESYLSEPLKFMDTALLSSLRTFVSCRSYNLVGFNLDNLFTNLKFIHVLCLRFYGIEELPDSVGNLRHLRYLDLSGTKIKRLPESLCSLYNLQTLKLNDYTLEDFPQGMSSLICLRHLEANLKAISQIAGIGKLTALQELKMFTVDENNGHRIEELKDLSELRGELKIIKLNNVSTREEASRARLVDKEHLQMLELEWEWDYEWDGRPRDSDNDVLEGLQPHPNLKGLVIRDYCGAKFPSWIEWLSNLETIELHCCLTWVFPPLGKLRFLKYLHINGSPVDRHLHPDNIGYWYFGHQGSSRSWDGSLEQLQSFATQGWEGREGEEVSQLFPNLRVLSLSNCFKLKRLPSLPPTLTELFIEDVELSVLPGLWGCDGMTRGKNEPSSSSLSSLHISKCSYLTSLRQGLLQQRLQALESLTISMCSSLESFPEDGLRTLKSLKSLVLQDCDYLIWLPEFGGCLPSSLVDLKIIRCTGIITDSFFMGLQNLKSLSSLKIQGSRHSYVDIEESALTSLPGELLRHMTALKDLDIEYCRELTILEFQSLASLQRLKLEGCHNLERSPLLEGCGPSPLKYLNIERGSVRFLTADLNLSSLRELRITLCEFTSEVEEGLCSLTSLRRMYIDRCLSLEFLLSELHSLASLEELSLSDCSHFESLPEKGMPTSLIILAIKYCGSSLVERCMEGGPDWPKIAHIPFVEIDYYKIITEGE